MASMPQVEVRRTGFSWSICRRRPARHIIALPLRLSSFPCLCSNIHGRCPEPLQFGGARALQKDWTSSKRKRRKSPLKEPSQLMASELATADEVQQVVLFVGKMLTVSSQKESPHASLFSWQGASRIDGVSKKRTIMSGEW